MKKKNELAAERGLFVDDIIEPFGEVKALRPHHLNPPP
jgi:hypothetical protein